MDVKKEIYLVLSLSLLLLLSAIFPAWAEAANYDPSLADNDTRLITVSESFF